MGRAALIRNLNGGSVSSVNLELSVYLTDTCARHLGRSGTRQNRLEVGVTPGLSRELHGLGAASIAAMVLSLGITVRLPSFGRSASSVPSTAQQTAEEKLRSLDREASSIT